MKIDHTENPLGIIKRYDIFWNGELQSIQARIYGITEEGFDEVNWYGISVFYPEHHCELGGNLNNYNELKRGAPTFEEAEANLKIWCKEGDFEISEIEEMVTTDSD